jgi:hypothetical protein
MMNTHPYVRAYMAGIAVPTMFLLVILSLFIIARLILQVPVPIERVIVFPMAAVPNVFGLWNMFYLWLREHGHISIGLHGAILPFVLAPLGYTLASSLGFLSATSDGLVYFDTFRIGYAHLAAGFCVVLVAYYLAWKYLVNFFNGVAGIA